MLKKTLLFVALLTLIPTLAFAESVTASIDGNCGSKNGTITVPAGKTASGFTLGTLAAGTKCKVGGAPDTKGWGVTKGGASAVLAASIFHFGDYTIAQAKAHMAAAGIPVRTI